MTPEQCREARERLKWSRYDLAEASHVPLWFIAAFEDKRDDAAAFLAHYELAMSDALEVAGIGFPPFDLPNGRVVNDPAADIAFQNLADLIRQEIVPVKKG